MYVDYALTQPISIFSTLIVMTEQHVIWDDYALTRLFTMSHIP
jgi:hypothetical protein